MTLLQAIDEFLDNLTVTDRQEENIKSSLSNLNGHLLDKDNNLYVKQSFTIGSYDRDTNIRPLTDIDLFSVLDRDKWQDKYGNLPDPQGVLTKIKNYLDDLAEYKGKVKQDRPCVTLELSNKDFDILPSFKLSNGGYLIPSRDLKSWIFSYPEELKKTLDNIHTLRNYKVKPTIKAIKYWNRETGKYIPSFHIEEVAIRIFQGILFTNYEESIRLWFENAEYHLQSERFDSSFDYETAVKKIQKVKAKLKEAKDYYEKGEDAKAKQIWKAIFDREFPAIEQEIEEEAKGFSKSLSQGNLKISPLGTLSTSTGYTMSSSKGYFGDVSEK
jgi:hypothetical protein